MSVTPYAGDDRTSLRLRQRFLVWSVAIVSSLSSSGLVTLSPPSAWAQEEPAAARDDKPSEFDRAAFNQLLQDREYDRAAAMLDAALAQDPFNPMYANLNSSLALSMLSSQPEAAVERLKKQYQALLDIESLDDSQARTLATTANMLTMALRTAEPAEKLAIIDAASNKLGEANGAGSDSQTVLAMTKARLLATANRTEEAKQLLDSLLSAARQGIDPEQPSSGRGFLSLVTTYSSLLARAYPEEVAAVEAEGEQLALAGLAGDSITPADIQPYVSLKMGAASRLRMSDPKGANKVLDDLENQLASLKDRLTDAASNTLERQQQQIAGLRKQMEAALKREELIGTAAPPLDAEHFVAMDTVSMDDLKGKVVLLDFWAVWCGPCIATFPHLVEWQEEYADKGLVIIGATRFYNYRWDEAAGRAVRAGEGETVEAEEELAMLEKFRESYGLHHGFMVAPTDSDYAAQFQVTGIPQAVLVDQEGKIRMIRVGSGEANAEALEAEIRTLLGL